jgi:hypothetical protein
MEVSMLLHMRNRTLAKPELTTLGGGEVRTMRKIITSALAVACLFVTISPGNAGSRRNATHDSTCAYVWNGLTRMPSCQMLAPIKPGPREIVFRTQARFRKGHDERAAN